MCVCYIFHALESSVGCARRSFIKGRQSTPHHVFSLFVVKDEERTQKKEKKGYLGSHKVLFLFSFFFNYLRLSRLSPPFLILLYMERTGAFNQVIFIFSAVCF